MSSISKPDHCTERPSPVLLSAYQEYLMTFKLMTSQVVQRARPLITHICVIGAERVNLKAHFQSVRKFNSNEKKPFVTIRPLAHFSIGVFSQI